MRTKLSRAAARPTGCPAPLGDQRGFLLVMVMVVMLVLSTVVASTLINSFLERSLAKNQNYASVGLQAAEGGLAAGVTWVRENKALLPAKDPFTGLYPNWTQTLARQFPAVPIDHVDNDTKAPPADGRWDDLNANGVLYPTDPYDVVPGGGYLVTLRFKQEWRDVNGDGDCIDPGEDSGYKDSDGSPAANCPGDVVLYNKCSGANNCFGFPDSLYFGATEGYPVIEIDSVGYFGTDPATASSFRQIALDLARNRMDIQVEGALTARGHVQVKGAASVDGHNYNMAGTAASSTCSDLPAVTVNPGAGVTAQFGCTQDPAIPTGNTKGTYSSTAGCNATHDPTAPGKRPLAKTPWDVIGIPQADFDNIFTATTTLAAMPGTATSPAYVWQKGDLHVNGGNGYGILVVHNENFNPDVYDVSCPTCLDNGPDGDPGTADDYPGLDGVLGTADDGKHYNPAAANYDPRADSSNAAYDASFAPATFFMNGTCTFTGVVIADKILRVNGTATTIGAVISMGGVTLDGTAIGTWSAKYSCDAIENALGGFGYGTRIAWHRLR